MGMKKTAVSGQWTISDFSSGEIGIQILLVVPINIYSGMSHNIQHQGAYSQLSPASLVQVPGKPPLQSPSHLLDIALHDAKANCERCVDGTIGGRNHALSPVIDIQPAL